MTSYGSFFLENRKAIHLVIFFAKLFIKTERETKAHHQRPVFRGQQWPQPNESFPKVKKSTGLSSNPDSLTSPQLQVTDVSYRIFVDVLWVVDII